MAYRYLALISKLKFTLSVYQYHCNTLSAKLLFIFKFIIIEVTKSPAYRMVCSEGKFERRF